MKPKPGVSHGVAELVSDDKRRSVREAKLDSCSVKELFVKSSIDSLGNHFHRLATETVYITVGHGVLRTAKVDKNGKIRGKVKCIDLPYFAHSFELVPGTKLFCVSSPQYDNADCVPCEIPD